MVATFVRNRLKAFPRLVALVRFVRALATPLGRGRLDAGRRGAQLFQPATVTRLDRHPGLFAAVAARLGDNPAPRLLSFGCSTGEEAVTLARYLPHARIDAIDANPACIAQARRTADRLGLGQIRFACADTPNVLTAEGYDAVFCLSVLRHGDLDAWRPDRCTRLLPFSRFAAAVDALDRCIRPGGLLILWGCNFRFTDAPVAVRYRAIVTPGIKLQPGPFYGADDRLLPHDNYAAFVFLKR
ncbi:MULTISPECIES: methyltransferase domain-containing protein [unclassified Sphingomonas]|uniref:methyltransferase domain-containing protein n=1 Tax=unclassified Sphingomonas TaxID=196159 RepID=UPI0009E682B5|nr:MULTISPECIES: methyltransferase domain-containing protein [unclassified Sphingomonas]TCP65996.1 methyltransferase family protein [Sphingomonas sp. PP-CE-1G-424]